VDYGITIEFPERIIGPPGLAWSPLQFGYISAGRIVKVLLFEN